MSDNSDIEWTDATWNPVRGCTKVSPGCKHCYAETFAERFRGVPGHPYEQGFDPMLVPHKLADPLKWKKPRTVFVNSMSDLFQDVVPDEYVAACFGVMAACSQHTFQVLTKRAERLPLWFEWLEKEALSERKEKYEDYPIDWLRMHVIQYEVFRACGRDDLPSPQKLKTRGWPLPNVHLGVSVEDRKYGLPRIEHLRRTPAALRFLSIEPLLEDLGEIDLNGIGWIIVGGESGPGARSCDLAWIRSVVRQCREQGVPVFVKQLGAAASDPPNGLAGRSLSVPREAAKLISLRLKSPKGGDPSEWPDDLRVREMPRKPEEKTERPMAQIQRRVAPR